MLISVWLFQWQTFSLLTDQHSWNIQFSMEQRESVVVGVIRTYSSLQSKKSQNVSKEITNSQTCQKHSQNQDYIPNLFPRFPWWPNVLIKSIYLYKDSKFFFLYLPSLCFLLNQEKRKIRRNHIRNHFNFIYFNSCYVILIEWTFLLLFRHV